MHRSLSGHRPRPPSPPPSLPSHRRGQHSLTIRTAGQQTPQVPNYQPAQHGTQHGTSTAPPQPPYPIYPLPIPAEKQLKARKLYHKYQLEATLERSKHEPQSATSYHNSYLSVPGPQSVTSRTSSRHNRAASISTSAYDAVTDLSSVVSFDGDESLSVKTNGELLSFDGTPVKSPRIRRRLSSVKRAKAALVRHLGSCWVCHSRKVPCPLEHHDLESLVQSTPLGNRTQSRNQFFQSPNAASTIISTSLGAGKQTHPSLSQSDALAGIEGNAGLHDLGPIAATLDIQSPSPYGDTQLPAIVNIDFLAPVPPTSLYQMYQNGDMFPLGVCNIVYYCQHMDGVCNDFFETDEELQQHFAIAHFAFTRITPAQRYVCSKCQQMNNDINGPCYNCQAPGSIQLWIYGNYIRISSHQRYAPDGQDFTAFETHPAAVSPMVFPNGAWNFDINTFDNNGGPGGFNIPDGGFYGGPGNQAYGYNPPSGSGTGGSQFQGSIYGGARQFALSIHDDIKLGIANMWSFIAKSKITKITLLILALLVIVNFGVVYRWMLCNTEAQYRFVRSKLHTSLPYVGFLVILSSFALSILTRYITNKRLRTQAQSGRCPLHAFTNTSIPLKCRPPTTDTRFYVT